MFALFSVGCIIKLVGVKSISEALFPVIGLAIFLPPIHRTVKIIRDGASSYPTIALDEPAGTMVVQHKDLVVTVDVHDIKNLRLQIKSCHLVSVIITTSSGETLRLEGYENLEGLAAGLERLTPKERVTHATFYHR
jgi:hypothetical protein